MPTRRGEWLSPRSPGSHPPPRVPTALSAHLCRPDRIAGRGLHSEPVGLVSRQRVSPRGPGARLPTVPQHVNPLRACPARRGGTLPFLWTTHQNPDRATSPTARPAKGVRRGAWARGIPATSLSEPPIRGCPAGPAVPARVEAGRAESAGPEVPPRTKAPQPRRDRPVPATLPRRRDRPPDATDQPAAAIAQPGTTPARRTAPRARWCSRPCPPSAAGLTLPVISPPSSAASEPALKKPTRHRT